MSANDPSKADNDPPPRTLTQRDSPAAERDVWLFAWLGIALAGGVFGLAVAAFRPDTCHCGAFARSSRSIESKRSLS